MLTGAIRASSNLTMKEVRSTAVCAKDRRTWAFACRTALVTSNATKEAAQGLYVRLIVLGLSVARLKPI
jgi:hypothetical protein